MDTISIHNIAIVVPCYNEGGRLDAKTFINEVSGNPHLTILFVNDGSKDDTLAVIQKICTCNPQRALCLSLEKNKGKGEAVRLGMIHLLEKGTYEVIGFWDADLAVPFSELWIFLEFLRNKPDVRAVIGSRVHLAGRSIEHVNLRHYIGRLFATVICVTFKLRIYDTQCGAKIFDSRLLSLVVREPFCSQWIFDVELMIRISQLAEIQSNDHWIYEVPINSWFDVSGTKRSVNAYLISFYDYLILAGRYFLKNSRRTTKN